MDEIVKKAQSELQEEQEKQFRKFLLRSQVVRQLLMEHEHFDNLIKKGENENKSKAELTPLWMEADNRRDNFKKMSGLSYSKPLEYTRNKTNSLIRFFHELSGFTWSKSFGWIGQSETLNRPQIDPFEATASLYEGIVSKSDNDEVTGELAGFDMDGIGLDGPFPSVIAVFEKCRFLNMNWNLLCGNIPRNIAHLANLTTINLSGNLLTGVLDAESFARLTSLTHLDLSFNEFTGPIPDIFNSVNKLKVLNLSGNNFVGELPITLSQLVDLVELKLYNNNLVGTIHSDLGSLLCLQHINLSQNGFSEGVNVFNSCHKLVSLQLQQNKLRERLDNSTLFGLTRLEVLYLQDNELQGLVPDSLCLLSKLKRLNLSRNNFRGLLPENIGELANLESLLLTGNAIVGPVPLSIAKLKQLRDFHIFRSYPSEFTEQTLAFNKVEFERVYEFAPAYGINSMHWDYKQVYGREREPGDNDSVTVFSGTL